MVNDVGAGERASRAEQSRDDNDALCVSIAPGMLAEQRTQADRDGDGEHERGQKEPKGFLWFLPFFLLSLSLCFNFLHFARNLMS